MKRFASALMALLAAQLVGGPPPKLIREIDLNQISPGSPGFRYVTLSFSPDENWIAIVGMNQLLWPLRPLHVGQLGSGSILLVPVNGPADHRVHIDPGLYAADSVGWSPTSDAFFAQGLAPRGGNSAGMAKLWNLRGDEILHRESPATLPDRPIGGIFGFLDAEHLLVRAMPAKRTQAAFETIDLHGKVVHTWKVPKHWRVVDVSPDRNLLAIRSDEQSAKTLVVDYPSKKTILTKDNPYGTESEDISAYFTEGGKTLCSVDGSITPEVTECCEVDSGKKIAKFDGFAGGAPAAASSHGSRLVLTHGTSLPLARGYFGVQRVVWDFRAGTEVASWEPFKLPMLLVSAIAISSTGRYVAEVVDEQLRIYELP
jgi:hypothetical protein